MGKESPLLRMATLLLILFLAGCCAAPVPSEPVDHEDASYPLNISVEGSLQNPAWSPDGGALLLTRFRNGYNRGPADLLVYDLQAGSVHTLVADGSDNVNLPGSAWNSSTHQIVFSSSRGEHDEIYLIPENGRNGQEIQITAADDRMAYEPSLSPDGQWVVFESHPLDDEGNGVIVRHRLDGTGATHMLTDPEGDCRQPNWSPDGTLIVYQAQHAGQWDLWVMQPDGTDQRQLTTGDGDETDATFSPDGRWVVYSADGPDIAFASLFVVPVSGGEATRLTFSNRYDGAPAWSPDGSRIAFESSPGDPEDSAGTEIRVIDFHP